MASIWTFLPGDLERPDESAAAKIEVGSHGGAIFLGLPEPALVEGLRGAAVCSAGAAVSTGTIRRKYPLTWKTFITKISKNVNSYFFFHRLSSFY